MRPSMQIKLSNSSYMCMKILLNVVKWATVINSDYKAPFSIATTPRCRRGRYTVPWIAPFYP